MKIKQLILLAGICVLAAVTTAFIQPTNGTPEKIKLLEDKVEVKDQSFTEFLNYFKKIETPFEIGLENFSKYEKLKQSKKNAKKNRKAFKNTNRATMRKYIPEIKTGMYSRMGPPAIEPLAKFYPNENTIAVIYMTYWPLYLDHTTNFHLVVFDAQGNNVSYKEENNMPVDQSFFMARESSNGILTFKIDEAGYIWRNNYEPIWKEDVHEKGIAENEIIDYKLEKTEVFLIGEYGLVEQAKELPEACRVSLN